MKSLPKSNLVLLRSKIQLIVLVEAIERPHREMPCNEIDPHLTLSRYIHLLMTYEHLTSRGDNSPKWTEIKFCKTSLLVIKLEKFYPIRLVVIPII